MAMNVLLFIHGFCFTSMVANVICLSVHDPRLSPGHLKPLGEGRPKIPVETAVDYPSPKDFFTNYVDKKIPFLIHGAAKSSPGFTKWNEDYFRKTPDINSMLVSVDRDKKELHNISDYVHMKFERFLNKFQSHELYLVDAVKPPLQKDVLLPSPLRCKETRKYLQDTALWYSSGGTKSLLSLSFRDEIACVIRGRNEYLMLPYMKNKEKFQEIKDEVGLRSVDVERVDFGKYPQLEDVDWMSARLSEGDCLYIPYKWAVQVNSYGGNKKESLFITFSFNHIHDHRPTNCAIDPSQATLDKYQFSTHDYEVMMQQEAEQHRHHAHEHGHSNETGQENGHDNDEEHYHDGLEKVQDDNGLLHFQQFRTYLKNKKSKSLNFKQFMDAMKSDREFEWTELNEKSIPDSFEKKSREIYDILDSNHDSSLTYGDFKRIKYGERYEEILSDLDWRIRDLSTYVSDYLESIHHGVSSEEFEVNRKARELRKKLSIHDPMEL